MVKKIKTVPKTARKRRPLLTSESDGQYFLKLVIYILLGTLWLKFAHPIVLGAFIINGFPIGLLLGAALASRDKFQVDRKIAYAILIMMTILTYFLPAGIVI